MKSLYKKLSEAQAEMPKMTKDKKNPFFKSSYFDINQIMEVVPPILKEHGLTIAQPLSNVSGRPAIRTIIMDIDTGESIEDTITMPDISDPQKMGSCVTYYRRYALQSILGLEAEDDDGNKTKPTPKEYYDKAMKALSKAATPEERKKIRDYFYKVVTDKEWLDKFDEATTPKK